MAYHWRLPLVCKTFLLALGLLVTLPLSTVQAQSPSFPFGTVGVVPFTNISGDPTDSWISEGITETIISDFKQLYALPVVSNEATARERGVLWLVTGGFQRLGSQLRITARVMNVQTGIILESIKVDGEFDELFTLQDQIADGLAAGFNAIRDIAAGSGQGMSGTTGLGPTEATPSLP